MIYLIRHGETEWNLEERKQGHRDSMLTARGRRQAIDLSYVLRDLGLKGSKIYSSPLGRVRTFRNLIFDNLGISPEVTEHDSLREHGFGDWEGLTPGEIEARFPGEQEKRKKSRWNYIIPGGGESYEILDKRVRGFLSEIDEVADTFIFSHEMVGKAIRGVLLDLDREDILDLDHPHNVVFRITKEGCKYRYDQVGDNNPDL
jgi:probable phosphoglycerate mutase